MEEITLKLTLTDQIQSACEDFWVMNVFFFALVVQILNRCSKVSRCFYSRCVSRSPVMEFATCRIFSSRLRLITSPGAEHVRSCPRENVTRLNHLRGNEPTHTPTHTVTSPPLNCGVKINRSLVCHCGHINDCTGTARNTLTLLMHALREERLLVHVWVYAESQLNHHIIDELQPWLTNNELSVSIRHKSSRG